MMLINNIQKSILYKAIDNKYENNCINFKCENMAEKIFINNTYTNQIITVENLYIPKNIVENIKPYNLSNIILKFEKANSDVLFDKSEQAIIKTNTNLPELAITIESDTSMLKEEIFKIISIDSINKYGLSCMIIDKTCKEYVAHVRPLNSNYIICMQSLDKTLIYKQNNKKNIQPFIKIINEYKSIQQDLVKYLLENNKYFSNFTQKNNDKLMQ